MNFSVRHALGAYEVHCERGALSHIGDFFRLDRRVLIVTDSGVPKEYAAAVAKASSSPVIYTVRAGEKSKSLRRMKALCKRMLKEGFTRSDCVVAVGGGVVGDLACFAAASYMRGIDFYNIPTTVLSAVDSSVGGKCGVNFRGAKNLIGAFYQPKAVVFDADTLKTLPKRQIGAGLAEAIKMAATFDEELFKALEAEEVTPDLYETLIFRAVQLKARIVEQDEREGGLRKTLNYGHTLGHAIEAAGKMKLLYHGECVALGMLPFCSQQVYERLHRILKKFDLPTALPFKLDRALPFLAYDKKWKSGTVDCIFVSEIGKFEIRPLTKEELFSAVISASARFKD